MYDAIVVGARCAGSPTAMLLARQGHRVLLVDKARFPSDRLSTHLLKPRAMAYLDIWGLRDALVPLGTPFRRDFAFTREGITLTGRPGKAALTRCLERAHGWEAAGPPTVEWACVRRRVLDQVLLDAAIAAGADFRERCSLDELVSDGGRVTGVRLRTGGRVVTERAPVVVGADGRHSRVAERVGAGILDAQPECTYTTYAYFSGVDADAFRPPVHLRGRLGIGFAPTNDDLALVSVWGPGSWFPAFRRDLDTNFLRTLDSCYAPLAAELKDGGRRETPLRSTVDLTNVLRRAYGPGWVLVGDAGCHVDQCTAIGISHAFRDAQLAADAIHGALGGVEPMDGALAGFERRRLAELRPSFDYVATVAHCAVPRVEQLRLHAALRSKPADAGRFLGFGAMIVPPADYFSPGEREQLVQEGSPTFDETPEARQFATAAASYEVNPWL